MKHGKYTVYRRKIKYMYEIHAYSYHFHEDSDHPKQITYRFYMWRIWLCSFSVFKENFQFGYIHTLKVITIKVLISYVELFKQKTYHVEKRLAQLLIREPPK